MHPEVEELRPKLKEVLYDCAVDIRATKAALYLRDGARFELVTEYGFRNSARQSMDANDPIADRCGRGRTPFYINGLAVEPRFAEVMFETQSERLLAAPIYSRGELVGLIDMRDKAAKQMFEQSDIPKAQKIAEKLIALFANRNVFGQRFITLSEAAEEHAQVTASTSDAPAQTAAAPSAAPAPRPAPVARPAAAPPLAAPKPAPPPPPTQRPAEAPRPHVPRLATLVIEARSAAGRIAVAPTPESLGEPELAAAREVLRSILLIPGVATAMLSAFGHLGGIQEIAARTTLSDEAKNLLQSKLNVWLTKRGEAGGFVRTSVQTPFGTSGTPIDAQQLQKVFTAPLNVGSVRGLYLTVAFATTPDRAAHELLAALHSHLQLAIEQSMQRGSSNANRVRIAEKLLEPDFAKYPELRRHSENVAKLAESFARFLALSPADVENARILGLVHDAGMRLLDYERLYRKSNLSQDELSILREHVAISAVLVEPFLGGEIARAVLCHHERVDGRGYPNELHGDEIPMLARLVQLCDAYVAITDPDTYQTPERPDAALSIIARGAGSQFDHDLAARFADFVRIDGAR
ncbi:MAG TPA: HD domain-containing phosphohydrolase [Thermoanaerobaculia bacterium]|nr:HD domain-containing phosphohydrolase [Thermoanaerobaculia bacterium]